MRTIDEAGSQPSPHRCATYATRSLEVEKELAGGETDEVRREGRGGRMSQTPWSQTATA